MQGNCAPFFLLQFRSPFSDQSNGKSRVGKIHISSDNLASFSRKKKKKKKKRRKNSFPYCTVARIASKTSYIIVGSKDRERETN